MKKLILTLFSLIAYVSSFAQLLPIYTSLGGPMSGCIGVTTRLSENDSSSAAVWTSSNTAVASVTGSVTEGTAVVTGISAGVAIITYTLSGSYVTASFTVSAAPAAITGTTPTCVGATASLTDATTGGTWSSGNTGVATVAATGVVTGVHGGSTDILYTVGAGCPASIAVTIASIPDDSIFGAATVCAGSTTTLTDATTGGTWTSANTAIATVNASTGVVTGVSAGGTNITYSLTTACAGSGSNHHGITVDGASSAGTISGPPSIAVGAPGTLSDGIAGGTWSSSNTAIATVSTLTGVATGVAPGTTTITYTVGGCTGTVSATANITVTAFTGISGYVNYPSASCAASVKVWLITYNPSTLILEAVDSGIFSTGGLSVYYQFTGLTTDSFRVKAAPWDAGADTLVWGGGCTVPTYRTSAFYWHDADVIYYTTGSANIDQNINMATGATTSGPGFIGGSVTSGANRGTSTGAPVEGLLLFLQNAVTGDIVQQTYTDASGNYSFSSLAYGTYFVYPELINYATTPYTSITLSAATPSVSTAGFIEHTVSMTITPVNEAVNNVKPTVASVVAYPNPTSGILNILWNTATNETGNVSITDITGREVYKTTIQMNAGSGISQADLSGLTNGLYLISVKSASISYNNKIELQH